MAAEGDQGTPSKPKLRPYELLLKKAIGLYFMTDELMEDSVAMQGVLEQGFQTELEFFVEDKFIRGSGSGEPLGLLNAGCTVSQAIEGGQTIANTPASIVLNATKMKSQMPPSLYRNAVWLANAELEPYLVAATLGGTAAAMPVFLQQGSLANSPYAQLLGKPLIYTEYCEAVGTPGDFVLAALGEYGCCDKNGATGASSIHLRFDYDETAFRVTYRFDGAPSWKQSVTKYKGSGKWAPFITLATRT
jgi:HK97 family phage major capsid protein